MWKKVTGLIGGIFHSKKRLILVVLLLAVLGFGVYRLRASGSNQPQYQTATAQTGTLVENVTASGQVTNGNSVSITTQSSGVIKDVYVKNGDSVAQGQTIADLTLDQASQQKLASAYSTLLQAQSTLASDNAQVNTLQNEEFVANQKFINDAVARNLTTDDPTYIEEDAAWLAAEQNFENQQKVIAQAQQAVTSDELAYQQISPNITAPISGTVSGLTVTPGSQIVNTAQTNSSNNTATLQSIGSVNQPGPILAQVDVSEVDSVNVEPGQKVTMTLDAFPNETFAGTVLSVNTNGVVSSGVTTYPTTISFDSNNTHIYPNMSVNASIITKVENNVLLVPNTAVQTQNGQSFVRVLKNGQIQQVPVTTGDSNDTDTVITSGLSAGVQIVTSVITASQGSSGSSPFSGLRGGGGGGVIFRGGAGGGRGG